MDLTKLQEALDEIFDAELMRHAYTDYARDYEMLIALPVTEPVRLRYLFKYCVEARVSSALAPHIWQVSLDDSLLEWPSPTYEDGHIWGVRSQGLYPGAEIVPDSSTAREWSAALGRDFHEIRVGTNVQVITLVFADLDVTSSRSPGSRGPGG
ncbi:hypothetical protein ACFWY5_01685 [Nonomuraea sp. NPDC059007]|uniref:YxiG-like protein n=1 Tax=Nonomuraea sp. NPDC059007 TaxID=3346692 RepID=UPI0036CFC95B